MIIPDVRWSTISQGEKGVSVSCYLCETQTTAKARAFLLSFLFFKRRGHA